MKHRTAYLVILALVIVGLSTLEVSYAVWEITLTQKEDNVIESDCFLLNINGEKGIYLKNMIPMSKEELETQFFPVATPYHFTVTNQCAKEAKGSIHLETLSVAVEEEKLEDKWINVALYDGKEQMSSSTQLYNKSGYDLTSHPTSSNKIISDALQAYQLYEFTLNANETKEFNLLVFLDEDAKVEDNLSNKKWSGEITVYSSYNYVSETEQKE